MIDREMQRAHNRYQTDVNSAESSTHIPSNHAYSIKVPRCSSATNKYSDQEVVTDALQESSLIFEQLEDVNMSECVLYAAAPTDEQETCNIDVENQLLPDRQDGAALKKGDSSNNTTEQPTIETPSAEQTSPSSISTDVDIVSNDDAATVDQVELATTVEVQDVAWKMRKQRLKITLQNVKIQLLIELMLSIYTHCHHMQRRPKVHNN